MLLVINPHSFVDVITNSSSELFVCNTDKSVAAVKEILIKLTEIHNQKVALAGGGLAPVDIDTLFVDIFKEPRVSKYDFQYHNYEGFDGFMSVHDYDRSCDHPVHQEASAILGKWDREHTFSYKDSTEKERDVYYKNRAVAYAAAYKKWDKLCRDENCKLLKWVFKVNNIPWKHGNTLPKFTNKRFWNIADEFLNAINWGYPFKKGDIFIQSRSDNTVPYWMFDDIENLFHARRIHLG